MIDYLVPLLLIVVVLSAAIYPVAKSFIDGFRERPGVTIRIGKNSFTYRPGMSDEEFSERVKEALDDK